MTAPAATPRPAGNPGQERAPRSVAVPPAPRRTRWWQHLLDAVLLTAVTTAIVVWLYRLWDADLRVPLTYPLPDTDQFAAGDATFHHAVVTALLQGYWWTETNPQLGAPFGQQFLDFPLGPDHLHLVLLAGLAHLTGDALLAVNLYFLGGYLLIALVGWAVLRYLGLGRVTAVAMALLFAFAPFHQGQGESHLFLAAYVAVPLGALLLNWQLTGFAEWGPGRGSGAPGLSWRRLLAVLPIGAVVGSGSAYFAFFALVLLALTALAQTVARRSPRPLAGVLVLAGVPSVALLANLAPAILHQRQQGANLALARPPVDSWYFGLDIAQLLSPVEGHRVGALDRASTAVTDVIGWSEPGNNLGVVGVVGLAGLAVVVARRLSPRPGVASPGEQFRARQAWLAFLALLVATAGGLSLLIALGGPPQVRVWARMTVYVAFFVLCAVGSWVDERVRWPGRRPGRFLVRGLVATALVVVGVLDQTTGAYSAAGYRATQEAFSSDADFGARATRLLGAGSMVFQLPVIRFPEGGLRRQGMYGYDLLKAYLHAPELRWSYGAVKGRPEADWQVPVGGDPPEAMLVQLAAAGFSGLYVDREGYADSADDLLSTVQRLLGETPMRSSDGRLALFDLRPLRQRLLDRFGADGVRAVGEDVTAPLVPVPGAGFYPQSPGAEPLPRSSRAVGTLAFDNRTGADRSVELGLSVASLAGSGRLTVSVGDTSTSVGLTPEPGPVILPLTLPPGRTTVRLESTTPPAPSPDPHTADARFVVFSLVVVSDDRRSMVEACRPPSDTAPLGC